MEQVAAVARSEVELSRDLDNAVALLLGYGAEQGRVDLAGTPIETEIQVAVVERPQRVIQEIGAIEPELELFRLLNLEVLEETQVGIEESRSVNCRQNARSILADGGRDGEAARVDVLVRCEALRGIAGQDWIQLNIGRAQQRHVADVKCGARDLVAVGVHAEGLTLYSREVGAALQLRDAGELPAVDKAANDFISGGVAQLDGVRGVEDVRAVGRLNSVVVGEIETVERRAHDTHRLAEGVVHVDSVPALGANPRHLQGVVVGIGVIGSQSQIGEALQWAEVVRREAIGIHAAILAGQHGTDGNQVDVAAGPAAVWQVLTPVTHVGYLEQARPRRALRNGDTKTIGVGLLIVEWK